MPTDETDDPLDMSRSPLVNEERLETLVFQRSKQWSSLMKDWRAIDDGQEMDMEDLEEIYKDEGDDPVIEGEEEDEMAIEDPVAETKLDMANISASMGVAELTLILCAGEDNEAKAEMQEILNQTMPVVQGHKRKWKEAGLDRILDTFDEKQIEQHVGRWMRRNNSVYLEESSPPAAKCRYMYDHGSISEPSDNESLHSIDTARYIRQSRRRVPKKISNTATIKMYRKHSHKRDELRAKYAYDDEQEHRHHMQTLLHRRREKERQMTYVTATGPHCLHTSGHHARRKHLRKRRANSSLFDSSSDEEEHFYGRCTCRSCLTHSSLSRSASYQYCSYREAHDYHHYHRQHHAAASRTMHHLRRQHSYDMDLDLRPRMRENECNCCNSDQLCSNVVHIANSSTEEWVVENCNGSPTPKKLRQHQKHQLVAIRKANTQTVLSKCHKQKLPKIATKMLRSGETSDDGDVALPRKPAKNKINAIASAPATARKTLKQKKVPPQHDTGLMVQKLTPTYTDIVQSSDESEDEVKGRSRLVSFSMAKDTQKTSRPVDVNPKKTPSTKKPNSLPKIKEEANKYVDEGPVSSTKIGQETDSCSPDSNQLLDEQKKSNNVAETSDKSRKKPKTKSDGSKKIAASNKGLIDAKTSPANDDMVLSSDESEDVVKGRSRLVSLSAKETSKPKKTPSVKKTSSQTKNRLPKIPEEAVKCKDPGDTINQDPASSTKICKENEICTTEKTSSKPLETNGLLLDEQKAESVNVESVQKSRGRPKKNSDAGKKIAASLAPTKEKPKARKAISRLAAKDKVAVQSPDSQETPAEKVKSPKAKAPNQKSKKVKPSDAASLDEATNSDDDLQRALALSKATYKEEQVKRAEAMPPEKQSQSLLMFNNNSVTCNSTAVANNTASTRSLSLNTRGFKRTAAAAVTSTEAPDIISLSSSQESVSSTGGDADCTVVTSTTICEPPTAVAARKPMPIKISKRGILLHNSSSLSSSAAAPGGEANFTLTEQSLGEVLGERFARRYLKYHVGSRTFDSSHSVYYRPTPKLANVLETAQSLADLSSSSSSDDDVFDQIQKYGDVYSVAENAVNNND